eukprot:GILJ01004264.1.p1 GENE.GILJ01004264.1~~GILJ01004264.1.p1  ORF type:complete len:433 (+),score=46.51 GILJ01004264.1:120-1418(+)
MVLLPPPRLCLQRRVVVTGMGLVTPLGVGVKYVWNKLTSGECGIRALDQPEFASLRSKIAAVVPKGQEDGQFDFARAVSVDIASKVSPFIAYALAASREALADAQWKPLDAAQQERTGVAVGSGVGCLEDIIDSGLVLQKQGPRRVSPFFVPRILINLAAGHVSIAHGLKGPNHCAVTACATGAHSIGDAFRMIRHGDAEVMVAGGTEACVHPLAMAGFSSLKALSTKFNDSPLKASRPFDKDRDGFVIGEGAGVMVLEELEHAKRRGARIYAEIRGYGLSGDGHHITAPTPDGSGAYRAMQAAVHQSGLEPTHIDYINAHATSTPLGDKIENTAIKRLFGVHASNLAISSTKGAVGHLLGAAGAVEAIFTVLAIADGVVPPTLNLDEPEPEFDLNYVAHRSQSKVVRAALTNSFGFGGTNAALVFSKLEKT